MCRSKYTYITSTELLVDSVPHTDHVTGLEAGTTQARALSVRDNIQISSLQSHRKGTASCKENYKQLIVQHLYWRVLWKLCWHTASSSPSGDPSECFWVASISGNTSCSWVTLNVVRGHNWNVVGGETGSLTIIRMLQNGLLQHYVKWILYTNSSCYLEPVIARDLL